MAKILVLGESGSGKTTSLGKIPEFNIEGLNPKETFIIACTNKELPFAGWKKHYKKVLAKVENGIITDIKQEGNYYYTNNPISVANLISLINSKRDDIKNIVIDDTNYLMQDYYMDNAVKGGYDVYKKVGLFMGRIFKAISAVDDKNIIMLAHYESYKADNNENIAFRFKTVGNMTNQYITVEGKFSIVLFAGQEFDEQTKTVKKFFVTNYDGKYNAKSPVGMFEDVHIPNDMGYVLKQIEKYENGE
jgi:hypothetical protein